MPLCPAGTGAFDSKHEEAVMRREMKHPMIGLHPGSSQTDSLAVNSGIRQAESPKSVS